MYLFFSNQWLLLFLCETMYRRQDYSGGLLLSGVLLRDIENNKIK